MSQAERGSRKGKDRQVFASFRLGKSELALSISSLQEVVPCPEAIIPVPLSPDYLLGLFNLRGRVVPIVSAAAILKMEATSDAPERRVAVVEQGGVRVGLLFDATSEILAVSGEELTSFAQGEGGAHNALRGALKLEGGNRILQVIDPSALLKIENIPLGAEAQTATQKKAAKRSQCITFRAGELRFALPMMAIREIIKVPEIQPSVLNYPYSLGMVNLRGQVVPVVDLARFLEIPAPASADAENARIIVLNIAGQLFGFRVSSVENIVAYYEEDLLPIPLFNQPKVELFRGLLTNAQAGDAILLHESKLLSHEEILHLTQGHSDLYRSEEKAAKARKAVRRTFLNFRLDSLFSLPLAEVEEIALCGADLMKPPGYPAFVPGIFKLRGEVITVVDLRSVYKIGSTAMAAEQKILVVKGRSGKFGLLVDAVESISTADESEKVKLPSLLHAESTRAVEADIEAAEMKDASGVARTFLVFDLQKLLARVESPSAA